MGEWVNPEIVVVVDDDETNRAVFAHVLESAGFEVLQAATGGEAVEISRSFPGRIALLIVDSMLTDGWGAQVALAMREHCSDVPVLLTSGTPLEGWRNQDLQALSRLGASADFLPKPFQARSLMQKVYRLTSSTR